MNESAEQLQTIHTNGPAMMTNPIIARSDLDAVGPLLQITPAQARVESVSFALDLAYKNASTLKLTTEEAQALAADFPDEAFSLGAGGDPNLIYIEHAYLRQRLNQVLGAGAATPIRRREWAEDFVYFKEGKERKGVRVYVDLALVVRGCLVGEAIADAIYYPHNQNDSYSDTLEKAKSNAFRRCCKEFGVGLQVWMKGYCEGWKARKRTGESKPPPRATQAVKTPVMASSEPKKATVVDVLPRAPSASLRQWMITHLRKSFSDADLSGFAVQRGWLEDETHTLDGWKLEGVTTSPEALKALVEEIMLWDHSRDSQDPAPEGEIEEDALPEFMDTIIHIPRKGMKRDEYLKVGADSIKSLYLSGKNGNKEDADRLFGFAQSWEPLPFKKKDGTTQPPSQQDFDLRIALDQFNQWREEKEMREKDLIP